MEIVAKDQAARAIADYRLRMGELMLLSDLAGLGLAGVAGGALSAWLTGYSPLAVEELKFGVVMLVCLVLMLFSRLYPGVGLNPAEEIRLVTGCTFTALSFGIILSILFGAATPARLAAHLIIWLLSLCLVLGLRWAVRISAVRLGGWKEPVLIVAHGDQAQYLVDYFRKRLRLGFWPVMVATDAAGLASRDPQDEAEWVNLHALPDAAEQMARLGVRTALVDLPSAPEVLTPAGGFTLANLLPRLVFLSDMNWVEGASLALHDFEGLMGVESRRNELSALNLAIKSLMDYSLAGLSLLTLLPFFVLLGALIKFDSPGPVFYEHPRIGKGGCKIGVLKFRTMVKDADQALQAYLKQNPAAQLEWQQNQKLKNDPRITRVGKWLRRYSLDELPQLLNVLKGDLSLVGARPIVESEAHHYGRRLSVYTRFLPGITGLWQVSGRNNTTYAERVHYDVYYIYNWSVWLDVYILLRTVWVVLSRDGAY